MTPRLGGKYEDIEIDVTSKPIAEYQCDEGTRRHDYRGIASSRPRETDTAQVAPHASC
jgi:hypothetical protein